MEEKKTFMTYITIKDDRIDRLMQSRDKTEVPPEWLIVPDNFNGHPGDHIDWFTEDMIRIPDEKLIEMGKRFDKRGRWYSKSLLGRRYDISRLDLDPGPEWTDKPPIENEPFQIWDEANGQWIVDENTKFSLANMSYMGHLNIGYNIELPGFIYHYTSLDNFLKILDTKTFYMFDSYQMNDYKENYVIIDALNRVISYKNSIIPDDYLKKLYDVLNIKFKMGFAFISCFTELRDSISQWRAYGDDGNGICLIINPRNLGINYSLPSHNADTEKCISFHNVIYKNEQQDKVIEEILNIALHFSYENKKNSSATFAEHVFSLIARFAPIFKINEFQEEKEWRIIYETFLLEQNSVGILTSDTRYDIGFINTRNNLKSYFPLKIENAKFVNSVTGIILGPKSKMVFPYMEMSTLLRTKGFGHVQIINSNISYRYNE
jgi:hypothetical protein